MKPLRTLTAAVTLALAGTTTVRADVSGSYGSPSSYNIVISHVPDLDQKRLGLPGWGDAYCVPTSTMNWMAYFAQHGAFDLAPGFHDWTAPGQYDLMTGLLSVMGILMSTDSEDGTTGANGIGGAVSWLSASGYPAVVVRFSSDADWSPRLRTIAHHAANGAYVIPIVGWYDESDLPVIDRDGGHALSLVRAQNSDGLRKIAWRDPARTVEGDDRSHQSAYSTETYTITNVSRTISPFFPTRTMSRVDGYGDQGYIDALNAIYPLFVLTAYHDPTFTGFVFPRPPFGGFLGPIRPFESPERTRITHAALHADLSEILLIAESRHAGDPNRLWRIDPVTKASTLLDLGLADPRRLHVGHRRDLYVIDGENVVCVALDPEVPDIVRIVQPPAPPLAITSNDATDEVAVLTTSALVLYPSNLEGAPLVLALPDEFLARIGAGVDLVSDPLRGDFWAASETDAGLFRIVTDRARQEASAERLMHEALREPAAIDVGDDGRIYVSDRGGIVELTLIEDAGALELAPDPWFEGVEAGSFLAIARSATNHDPELHEGPAWRDVLPSGDEGESEIDCATDFDGNGATGFSDLVAVLGAWGPCPVDAFCEHDLDFSGAVGFSDLLRVLGAWGPCP